jgi:hypothetical protein
MFLKISNAPIPHKKHFIFLAVNAKLTPLDYVIMHRVIDQILSFLLVNAASHDSHWLDECENSTTAYLTVDQSHAACDQ